MPWSWIKSLWIKNGSCVDVQKRATADTLSKWQVQTELRFWGACGAECWAHRKLCYMTHVKPTTVTFKTLELNHHRFWMLHFLMLPKRTDDMAALANAYSLGPSASCHACWWAELILLHAVHLILLSVRLMSSWPDMLSNGWWGASKAKWRLAQTESDGWQRLHTSAFVPRSDWGPGFHKEGTNLHASLSSLVSSTCTPKASKLAMWNTIELGSLFIEPTCTMQAAGTSQAMNWHLHGAVAQQFTPQHLLLSPVFLMNRCVMHMLRILWLTTHAGKAEAMSCATNGPRGRHVIVSCTDCSSFCALCALASSSSRVAS